MATYNRRDYAGGAAETTIVGDITSSSTTITITASTGWPSGSNGPFLVVIDDGTASEEKVQVLSRSGTTLTVNSTSERGYDGTTAAAHSSGASIKHCHGAQDADEANYWVAELAAAVNTAGDLPIADGNNSLTTLAKGSNSTVLQVSSGGTVQYATVATAMIADDAVSNAKLAGMTRGTIKVGDSGGNPSDLAIGTSGYVLTSDGTDVAWAVASGGALGQLAYAQHTAGMAGQNGDQDIPSLSVTVDVGAGDRRIKITAFVRSLATLGTNDAEVSIMEGSTQLQAISPGLSGSDGVAPFGTITWVGTPTSGEHTYKVKVFTADTSWGLNAGSAAPAFILVEDIGPA